MPDGHEHEGDLPAELEIVASDDLLWEALVRILEGAGYRSATESNPRVFADHRKSGGVELCFTGEDWAAHIRSTYAEARKNGMPSPVMSKILRSIDDAVTEIVGSGYPYIGLRSGGLVGLSDHDGAAWEVPEEFQPATGHWAPAEHD